MNKRIPSASSFQFRMVRKGFSYCYLAFMVMEEKIPIRDSPSAVLDPETAASLLFFESQSAGTLLIVLPIVVVMYFAAVCRNYNLKVQKMSFIPQKMYDAFALQINIAYNNID